MTAKIRPLDRNNDGYVGGSLVRDVSPLGEAISFEQWWERGSYYSAAAGDFSSLTSQETFWHTYSDGTKVVDFYRYHQSWSFKAKYIYLNPEIIIDIEPLNYSGYSYFDSKTNYAVTPPPYSSGDIYSDYVKQVFEYNGLDGSDFFDFGGFVNGGSAHGGLGNDDFHGSAGADSLYGEGGNDTLTGATGDFLDGGDGADIISGATGAIMVGGTGDDDVSGAVGATMVGGTGTDTLVLSLGDSTTALTFAPKDQVSRAVTLTPGTSVTGFERFSFTFGKGNDTLDLRGAALSGASSDFYAGEGNDTLRVDATSRGSANINNFETLMADLSGLTNNAYVSSSGVIFDDLYVNQWWWGGSLTKLSVTGGGGNDSLSESEGADILLGKDGNDTISGGADDLLDGGTGDDYVSGAAGASMVGGTGTDTLSLSLGDTSTALTFAPKDQVSQAVTVAPGTSITGFEQFELTFGKSNDTLDLRGAALSGGMSSFFGGDGTDTLRIDATSRGSLYTYYFETLSVDLTGLTTASYIGSGIWFDGFNVSSQWYGSITKINAIGGSGGDSLSGSDGADVLLGMAGNDTITGSAGDQLDGGTGDDYVSGAVGATMIGGSGTDALTLDLTPVTTSLTFTPKQQFGSPFSPASGTSFTGFEQFSLTFGKGNDTLDLRSTALGGGTSYFYGGEGADTLRINASSRGSITLDRFETFLIDLTGLTTAANINGGSVSFDGFYISQYDSPTKLNATGGSGNDVLSGGQGVDVLLGKDGNDTVSGGAGDLLDGGTGDDYVSGAAGATMVGGTGTDTLSLSLYDSTTALTFAPKDQVSQAVTVAPGTSITGFERFSLTFGKGNDTLDLRGAALSGGTSSFDGGDGTDTLRIDATSRGSLYLYNFDTLSVDLTGLTTAATIGSSSVSFDGFYAYSQWSSTVTKVNATGGSGNDTLSESEGADILLGKDGNDTISGGAGDLLDGGTGDDYVSGAAGATMVGGAGTDTLVLSLGDSTTALTFAPKDQVSQAVAVAPGTSTAGFERFFLTFGKGNDTLDLRGAALSGGTSSFDGGDGTDTLRIDATSRGSLNLYNFETLSVDLTGLTTAATIGSSSVSFDGFYAYSQWSSTVTKVNATGGSGNDTLSESEGADILLGKDGNDTISGGAGDLLDGGTGDDYVSGAAGATMVGGAGTDTLSLSLYDTSTALTFAPKDQVSQAITVAPGTSTAGFERFFLTFGRGNDTLDLRGAALSGGTSSFDGGDGTDTLRIDATSRGSLNLYNFETLSVDLTGLTTAATIGSSSVSFDGFYAYSQWSSTVTKVNATGGSGNDWLSGSEGNDLLDGGGAADTMTGAAGTDIFSFSTAPLINNVDHITDFSGVDDTIQLDAAVFSSLANGALTAGAFRDLVTGPADADDRILYDSSTGALFFDSDGSGSSAAMQFAILDNKAALTAADFSVVGASPGGTGGGGTGLNVIGGATAGNDSLVGTSANDLLDGGAGADTMAGGLGDDTYVVDNAADVVTELAGQGSDTTKTSLAAYTLSDNVEILAFTGTAAFTGAGNDIANLITGGAGADRLDGRGGADTLVGGAGSDTYIVDSAADVVTELAGQGTDRVIASVSYSLADNAENLSLGTSASINGTGNTLTNTLTGNAGANVLDGRGAADLLTGGAGDDTFVFRAGETAGDKVTDFTGAGAVGGDRLAFYGYGAGAALSRVGATDTYTIARLDGSLSEAFQLVGVTNLDLTVGSGNKDVQFVA